MDCIWCLESVFCEFVECLFEAVVAQSLELLDAAVGDDTSVVDDDGAAAHCFDFLHYVGGEEHYLAFAGVAYHFAYLFQLVGVEACGGLVEDEHLRVVDEGLRQSHALAVAFGEGADFFAQFGAEACELDYFVDALTAVFDLVYVGDEAQELRDIHLGVERVVLGQVAYAGAYLLRLVEDAVAADFDFAFRGGNEAGDDFHQCGLACAVRAEESDDFAGFDFEAYAVEGPLRTV